jgi:hypothetical protein
MDWTCKAHGTDEKCIHNLIRKLKVKIQFGSSMNRLKDNVKFNLKETGCEVWTGFVWLWIMAQWRAPVTMVMGLQVG